MAVVGYATVQLIPSLKGFGSSVNGQMRPVVQNVGTRAGKEAGGLFGGSFVGSVGRIMAAAGIYEIGSRVAGGISDAITTGIKGFANLQTYTISFQTLLGSASKANDMIRNLYDFAAKTPFDVEGSVVGAQKLLGVGVAAKDVVPTLTTLGDATAALGGSTADFNSVLLAYSQIMARGKVSTQDLYQISNTGIPIFQLLSQALGKPVGEIQKLIETGKLASEDVLPQLLAVMNQNYGGAMAGQAQTLTGLFSTFKDTMSQVLTQAMTPVGEWLSSILPDATVAATTAVQNISDFLGQLGTALANSGLGDSSTYQGFVDAFANTDWAGIGSFVVEAFTEIANGVAPVVKSLGDFVSTVLPPLSTLLGGLATNATNAGDSTSNAAGKMGEASQTLSDAAGENGGFAQFSSGMQSIDDQMNGLYIVMGVFGDYVAPVISGITQVINAFTQGESAAGVLADALSGKFGTAMQVVGLGIEGLKVALVQSFGAMGLAVATFVTQAIGKIGTFALQLVSKITQGLNNAIAAVITSGARFGSAMGTAVGKMGLAVTTKIVEVKTNIDTGISNAVAVVTGYVERFKTAGASIIGGLVKGVKSKIDDIKNAVSNAMSAAANFLPHSPAPEGPFSGKGWTLFSGRALIDGFAQGIKQRRPGLKSLMNSTLSADGLGGSPSASVAGSVASASGRSGPYIGSAVVNTTNGNAGVIDALNFFLRNLDRGGR